MRIPLHKHLQKVRVRSKQRRLTPIDLAGRHDAGESFGKISETGIPKTTIADTIHDADKRTNSRGIKLNQLMIPGTIRRIHN
jgi:hypothetical protein